MSPYFPICMKFNLTKKICSKNLMRYLMSTKVNTTANQNMFVYINAKMSNFYMQINNDSIFRKVASIDKFLFKITFLFKV